MATSPTVEQVEQHANLAPPVAEAAVRGASWKFTIDGNLVMIAGLLALALAAFSYLNSRIDGVASELRSEIKQLGADMNTKFASVDARFSSIEARFDAKFAAIDAKFAVIDAKFARVDDKFDKLDAKMDRLSDQLTQIIINQNREK